MPMKASWGMWPLLERAKAKIPAPRKVNARLIQYEPGPCGSMPTSMAIVAPSAAICASAKSTKITPRSTTCTPRYAWIPAMIRLARSGHLRNSRISIYPPRAPSEQSDGTYALPRSGEGLHEKIHIVIEELEIIGNFFFAADRGHQDNHFRAGFARYRVRRLQIEVWLHQDDLHIFPLHHGNQLHRVRRAGWNAGTRLHIVHYVQAEALRQVGPRAMVGDHFAPAQRLHLLVPPLLGLLEALAECLEALLEIGRIAGPQFGKLLLDAAGNAQAVLRVEPVVRVAERMHVAHRPGDLRGGNLQNLRELRSIQIPRRGNLNLRGAGLGDQRRQPADLQLQSDHYEQVRPAQLQQKAGFGFDKVRVLISSGDGLHVDAVAADLLRQGGQVGGGGNDVEL